MIVQYHIFSKGTESDLYVTGDGLQTSQPTFDMSVIGIRINLWSHQILVGGFALLPNTLKLERNVNLS